MNPSIDIRPGPAPGGNPPDEPQAPPPLGPEHYHAAVEHLLREATDRQEVTNVVEALTGALAAVLFRYERAEVTADILGRIARHLRAAADRQRAEAELKEMREAGRTPS